MNKFFSFLTVLSSAAVLTVAAPAEAAINVATSPGASFVSASSAIQSNISDYSAAISAANLLTDTPDAAYFNGDTRYIFANGDTSPFILIDLGKVYPLSSFGAIFNGTTYRDRQIPTLQVAVSNDNTIFANLGGSPVLAAGADLNSFTLTPASDVTGRYVRYSFGNGDVGCIGNSCGGAGVYRLLAVSSVPEPATWAMLLLGFGMIGFAIRTRSHVRTTVS